MSIFRNDMLGSWTRGGQAIVHNVRMTTQVFFQTMTAGLVNAGRMVLRSAV